MPRPTSNTVLQRPDLGALAYEYLIDAPNRGFIGLDLLPVFEVPDQSADYPIIPVEALLSDHDTLRAPRGTYNRDDWEFKTGTYKCVEHGVEASIDDTEARLYARYFDAEAITTTIAINKILRAHERRVAALLQANANTDDVTIEWSSPAATAREDVETARETMRSRWGITPNVAVMSYKVFRNVVNTTALKDAMKYTNPVEIGSEDAQRRLLAQYLGLENILIGSAQRNAAKKGQTASLADLWDDEYVHLVRTSAGGQGNLREPVYGRTFLWQEDAPQITVVESYREEQRRSTVIRVRQHVGEAVIFAGAAWKLGNITA